MRIPARGGATVMRSGRLESASGTTSCLPGTHVMVGTLFSISWVIHLACRRDSSRRGSISHASGR
eukprot:5000635-Pyramimonas_sp.AAC.1